MPRRGENIYKRKDGRWEGRYKKGKNSAGKTIYGFVYAKTYSEVKKKMDFRRMETSIVQPQASKISFQEVSEQWLHSISICSRESTMVKYRNLLNNHILKEFGPYDITRISSEQLKCFAQKKIQDGRLDGQGGLSPQTVKSMFSVIHSILKYARNTEEIPAAPTGCVRIRKSEAALPVITKEYQNVLEQYLLENETVKNIGILMCLYMGFRIGEICALKWENILLEEGIVCIRHTLQCVQDFAEGAKKKTKIIITPPKSSSSLRDVPIPDFLLILLKKNKNNHPNSYFLTGKTDIFLEPRTYEYYYQRVLEINHIPHINFHALRHTFATRCVEAGFDAKSLSEMLGHSKVNITLDKYVHITMEMKRKNMEKMAGPQCHLSSDL